MPPVMAGGCRNLTVSRHGGANEIWGFGVLLPHQAAAFAVEKCGIEISLAELRVLENVDQELDIRSNSENWIVAESGDQPTARSEAVLAVRDDLCQQWVIVNSHFA